MTRETYLSKLRDALSHLNPQEQDAAVEFCEEMIMERMDSGMTEEEAVAAMEAPALMAEKLAVEIRQPEPPAEPAQPENADPNRWQKMQLTCEGSRLNHIDLQTGNFPIKVLLSRDDQVRLTYYTRPRNVYEAKLEGDLLSLREVSQEKKGFFSFVFNFDLGTLPRPEIILEVPENLMVNLKAITRNGGITLTGPQMLMHVELGTTNGGMAVRNVKCISLDAHTTNGGVAAEQVETRGELFLRTTNGGVAASRCHSQASLILKTTNGGMAISQSTAGGEMNISSTNGSIKLDNVDAPRLSLRTTNAAISGTVAGPQSAWQIDSHTTNGKNSLPHHQDGSKPLSVHTTNASIRVTFC